MADGTTYKSALEKIGGHLECSVCTERFKQPKVLDCLHSYCEKCLEKYCQGASKIPCPLCRQETVLSEKRVQGLKTNFHLIALVEEMSLQEKATSAASADIKPLCEICCEGNEATQRCLDCAQNVCSNCDIIHGRIAATSNHTVATLEDIRQGKVAVGKKRDGDESRCQHHKGEVNRFYCETCEEMICRDCIVVEHCKPEHCYIGVRKAYIKNKQWVTDTLPVVKTDIQQLEKSLEVTSQAKQTIRDNVESAIEDVRSKAAAIKAKVQAAENEMIQAIKAMEKARNRTLNEQEKEVSVMLQRKKHSMQTVQDVKDNASESDFLSLHPVIRKDLEVMLNTSNPPAIDPWLPCLSFKQIPEDGDINLGVLDLAGTWELHREINKRGKKSDQEFAFGYERDLDRFAYARGVDASRPGEIAVADVRSSEVLILSTEGPHKYTISTETRPLDVAAVHDRLVVVDDTAYVKIYKADNTLDIQFPTVPRSEVGKTEVNLQSVAVKKDGTIVVGDVRRKVLTEHRHTDGKLIRTIPVEIEPHFLAVDSNDRVVISGWGNKQVMLADRNGTTLRTVRPDGHLSADYCAGVCSDLSESGFYVAMNDVYAGCGHVNHHNWDGTFLRCVAKDLYSPLGVTLTADGQLAIADCYSVKIYRKVYTD